MKKMTAKKVALVADALAEPGGASRVLKSLLKLFPEADVYNAVFAPEKFSWLNRRKVRTTFIQRLPFSSWWMRHYGVLSPLGFEQFSFADYDLVISLSAGCAKGIITTTDTFHLGIILTPPRGLWNGERKSGVPLLGPFLDAYQRVWDLEAGMRPDVLVSISKYIQRRVRQVYKRESLLIYPGIELDFWNTGKARKLEKAGKLGKAGKTEEVGKEKVDRKRDSFYLVVSRLYSYKRIDLAVEACINLGRKLAIVGDGPELEKLKKMANGHEALIKFEGSLSDKDVRDRMRKCKAFLFPGVEDFGLAPLEALACGASVIAFNDGGFAEVMKDGVTGVLFNEQTVDCLVRAIKRFENLMFHQKDVREVAEKFSENKFLNELKKVIKNAD